MSGPWRHPKSGIYYFRRDTPSDLKRAKSRLKALGIQYKGEVHRSLQTRDPKEAERRYPRVRDAVDSVWDSWRETLKGAPPALTHNDMAAMVGEVTRRFVDSHKATPEFTPPAPPLSIPAAKHFGHHTSAALKAVPDEERTALIQFLKRFLGADESERGKMAESLLTEYGQSERFGYLLSDVAPALAEGLRQQVATESKAVKEEYGKPITAPDEAQLNLLLLGELSRARSGLENALGLDYREMKELEERLNAMPPFEPHKHVEAKRAAQTTTTFSDIIDEEEKRSRDKESLMASRRGKSVATLKKYRRIAKEFSAYRRSDDATTITPSEVSAWMDHLFRANPKPSRTTVRDKGAALQALCKWGQRQSSGQLYPNGLPLEHLTLPDKEEVNSANRTYSLRQAQAILKASRKETKPERRWVPWLMAYSGMRVGEAAQLRPEDFEEIEGHWFAHIKAEGERTTKTHKGRWVPLHSSVVAEGIIDFVKAAKPEAPLFPARTQGNLSEWIHKVVLNGDEHIPPANHGFRHLFRDFCRRYRLDHEAEHFISGRSFGKGLEDLARSSARGYGGTELILKGYAEELEKIEPILKQKAEGGAVQ